MKHFDLLPLANLGRGPLAPRHDLAVHGDRDPPTVGRACRQHRRLDRGRLVQLMSLAVERHDGHARTLPNVLVSRSATASPVTGAKSTPFRQWPVAQIRPSSSASGPTIGVLSGVPGRSPALALTSSSSPTSGSTSHAA